MPSSFVTNIFKVLLSLTMFPLRVNLPTCSPSPRPMLSRSFFSPNSRCMIPRKFEGGVSCISCVYIHHMCCDIASIFTAHAQSDTDCTSRQRSIEISFTVETHHVGLKHDTTTQQTTPNLTRTRSGLRLRFGFLHLFGVGLRIGSINRSARAIVL